MVRSELIERLSRRSGHLAGRDVELGVEVMLEQMAQVLASGERIEIRGFGAFTTRIHPSRLTRNPRTGEPVMVPSKRVIRFKPGAELRRRVNGAQREEQGE